MCVLVSDALSEQGLAILRQTPGATIDYKPGLNEADLTAAIAAEEARTPVPKAGEAAARA